MDNPGIERPIILPNEYLQGFCKTMGSTTRKNFTRIEQMFEESWNVYLSFVTVMALDLCIILILGGCEEAEVHDVTASCAEEIFAVHFILLE